MVNAMAKAKKKGGWHSHGQLPKPLTERSQSLHGEIKTYFLSPEELEHYRNLRKPFRERDVCTTAAREIKRSKTLRRG